VSCCQVCSSCEQKIRADVEAECDALKAKVAQLAREALTQQSVEVELRDELERLRALSAPTLEEGER
jgi:predicted metal-binding protein